MTALLVAAAFLSGCVTGGWGVWHHARTWREQYRSMETDLFGLKDAAMDLFHRFPKGTP